MPSYSYIPGTIVMALLLVVLLLLRKRHATLRIDSWLLAFGFIIIATTAASLPRPHTDLRLFYHFLQLVFEMLAGLTFIYGAEALHSSGKPRDAYLLWNGPAMLALMVVYSWYIGAHWVYIIIITIGMIAACASFFFLSGRRFTALCQLAVWIYAAYLLHRQGNLYDPVVYYVYLRTATYTMLCFVYLLVAATCLQRLPKRSIGKFTIVTGMLIWAVCSVLHSWSLSQPQLHILVNQTWDMQKFLIATGLLLFLLEEQVASTQWLALHDQLTGLANRRLLEDLLPYAISTANRGKTSLTLFLFDLNDFKDINDTHGHRGGDSLLQHITAILKARLRETDTLARIGGDEFVLVAPGLQEPADIQSFLQFIHESIESPLYLDEKVVTITGSIGYAVYPNDVLHTTPEDSANQLLELADRRMYLLKQK